MYSSRAEEIFALLDNATRDMTPPMVELIVNEFGRKPFIVLAACLISLRSRDKVTHEICRQLFKQAQTPQAMLAIPIEELIKLLYKANFHIKKAHLLHQVSRYLIYKYNGQVPDTLEKLLAIPGVGLKTANLVLSDAFELPALCVDTHVHRISNRLGLVKTKTPEQTEEALKKTVPKKYWRLINRYLVMWGQNICVPISPFCSTCVLSPICPLIGLTKHR